MQDQVPPVEQEMIRQADLDELAAALSDLDGKERQVVRLRFGLEDDEPRTLQEIGDRMRLSRERVRQIESRAKEKLRRSARLRSHLN
jgi:RNA polymerase sigma factor (sigma-70 family)